MNTLKETFCLYCSKKGAFRTFLRYRGLQAKQQSLLQTARLPDERFCDDVFSKSLLVGFQQRMQDKIQTNNLNKVFAVKDIPTDSQIRDVLDPLKPVVMNRVFSIFMNRLQRGKHLLNYQFIEDRYLIAIDGSQYFSSEIIQYPHCLVSLSKGRKQFYHQIFQSVTYNQFTNQESIGNISTFLNNI